MKEIKSLIELSHDELDDAEKYAKLSAEYSGRDRAMSELFFRLSNNEIDHFDSLHEYAAKLAKSYGDEPPEPMRIVWEWEHERQIDRLARIKTLLSLAK